MKRNCRAFVALMAASAGALGALAQGTAFTYQGRLNDGTNPANGLYDMTFGLFSDADGTSPVGSPLPATTLLVSNGLFTLPLGFGMGKFPGADRWLQISVRTNLVGAFIPLVPLQKLTPTPYAITAENLNGTLSSAGLSGTYASALTLNNAANQFTGNGSGLTGVNAATLGGLAAANFWKTTGNSGTTAGVNFLGTPDNQDIVFKAKNLEGLRLTTTQDLLMQRPSSTPHFGARNGLGVYGDNSPFGDDGARLFAGQSIMGPVLYGEAGGGLAIRGASQDTLAVQWTSTGVSIHGPLDLLAGLIYSGGNTLVSSYGYQNFFGGAGAGNLGLSGGNNTANGYQGLHNNTSGYQNTASGASALFSNTTGSGNTANGFSALYANTSGSNNTANGVSTLQANTTGHENTANGYQGLHNNTSGYQNTASGASALFNNTTGSGNTANGNSALAYNTSGYNNTAIGDSALSFNTSGYNNTAVGSAALAQSTGNNNTALGGLAGSGVTIGNNNIDIGNIGSPFDDSTIRIGDFHTSTFIAGIYNATASGGAAVYVNSYGQLGTATSSRRYKDDIQDMAGASDVLLALQPVTFRYKPELDPNSIPQFGLVAEDVDKVAPDLVVRDAQHGIYTVRYEAVNAMLLNEFLKQHRKVEEQNSELETLKQQNDSLAERLEQLEQTVKSLATGN